MAKKVVLVSDVTGTDIPDGEAQTIVLRDYPGLDKAAVKLDAAAAEVDKLRKAAKEYVLLEIVSGEGGSPERLAIDVVALQKLVAGDLEDVVQQAERLAPPPLAGVPPMLPRQRRTRGSGSSRPDKVDYTDVQFAGRVKRGIVSEGEKATIRDHFDEVNANLAAAEQRTLDLANIEHVEKYGLQELAAARDIVPVAQG